MSSSPHYPPSERFVPGFNDGVFAMAGAAILLFAAVFWTTRGPNVEKTDFSLTYVGAKLVHDGMGHNIYDLDIQKQLRDSLFNHPVPLLFEHPPFEAFILAPLAHHSFRAAYLIWGCINASVWLALIAMLRRFLPWPRENLGYVCMWLLFAPLWIALYQGQSSILLLAFFAVTFVLLKRSKPMAAGAALGFGLIKFQFVLPLLLVLLLRKKWRFVVGFGTSASLLALLSFVGVGWGGLHDYGRLLFSIGSNPQNVSYGSGVDMPTINGFVYALFGNWLGHTELVAAVALLSLGLLGWLANQWQSIEASSNSYDLTFAAGVAASLLCGAHMFTHDFSPMILPILLVVADLAKTSGPQAKLSTLVTRAIVVLFWIPPIYFLFVKWHCLYLMAPVLLAFTWSAIQRAKFARQGVELRCVVADS
jgi:hypothetical protein